MSEIRENLRKMAAGVACLAEREEMDIESKSRYHSLNGAKPESHTMGNKLMLGMLLLVFFAFTNKAVGQFAGGSGTETDPYQISTPDHLVQLFYYLGNDNVYFKMINNIDLTSYLAVGGAGYNGGAGWSPIGNTGNRFSGTFNGAGFKITGLWINRSSTDYVGLFGGADKATISNLGIEVASTGINGGSYVGGLIGSNSNSTVINCFVVGNVSGTSGSDIYVGGLIGYNGGVVTNCYAKGNVSANNGNNSYVGGLIGYNVETVTNCYVEGNVNGSDADNYFSENYVGGLIGYNYRYNYNYIVSNCHFIGDVSGTGKYNSVGGLIGYNRSNVSDCYVTGNISGSSTGGTIDVGGMIGYNNSSITNCYSTVTVSSIGRYSHTTNPNNSNRVGGLIGANGSTVTKCYATSSVGGSGSSYNTYVGGLIGANSSTVTKCYATGDVDGSGSGNRNCIGGLVGATDGPTVSNCYAIGDVSNSSSTSNDNYIGGLIGSFDADYPYSSTSLSNCYAAGKVTGNGNIGGFIGYSGYYSSCTIDNSFFDYQTTGQIYAVGSGSGTINNLTGKSTAEMKTKSTFTSVNWDFTTIWNINEGVTYPFFINEPILIVSPTSYNFDKNGGYSEYITIEVTSNVEWTVTKDADWLTIYTTSGSNNGTFSIYASQNTGNQRSTTVTVSGGGETATISITQSGTVAIKEVESDKLQIFPNPTQNEIFIESELQIKRVEIYSIVGNLVFSESNFKDKISISALPIGIYTLKIYTNEGMVVRKVVKE